MDSVEEQSPKGRFQRIVQKLQTQKKSISETVGALIQKDPLEGRINSLIIQSQNLEKEFTNIFNLFKNMGERVYVDFAKQSENGEDELNEKSKSSSELNEKKEGIKIKNRGSLFGENKEISKSISPLRRGPGSFHEKRIGSSIGRLMKMTKEG